MNQLASHTTTRVQLHVTILNMSTTIAGSEADKH